jgi:ADP-ribose pyrophosphatase
MSIESQKTVFRGRVITVNVETVRLPNGHVADLEIVHHPGGAAIVALDARGQVCLVRQYRHAAAGHAAAGNGARGWVWELPAGKLEPGEPPELTARRELEEEAGRRASHWQSLGAYVSSPGVFTESVHLFMARDLETVTTSHEASEVIELHWVPLAEACRRALWGEIDDGKTIVGLLRAQARVTTGG